MRKKQGGSYHKTSVMISEKDNHIHPINKSGIESQKIDIQQINLQIQQTQEKGAQYFENQINHRYQSDHKLKKLEDSQARQYEHLNNPLSPNN